MLINLSTINSFKFHIFISITHNNFIFIIFYKNDNFFNNYFLLNLFYEKIL